MPLIYIYHIGINNQIGLCSNHRVSAIQRIGWFHLKRIYDPIRIMSYMSGFRQIQSNKWNRSTFIYFTYLIERKIQKSSFVPKSLWSLWIPTISWKKWMKKFDQLTNQPNYFLQIRSSFRCRCYSERDESWLIWGSLNRVQGTGCIISQRNSESIPIEGGARTFF
jgi:hypothetical protein